MKKLTIAALIAPLLLIFSISDVYASGGGNFHDFINWLVNFIRSIDWGNHGGHSGGGNSVPELDTAAGPIAVALLAAIIGIGLERRRRAKKQEG